jgi:hypothetical protein
MVDFENLQVLHLVQAMLGRITPDFRAISLVCKDGAVVLHFILEQDRAESRDEVEDIVFEFEALQQSNIAVTVTLSVKSGQLEEVDAPGRVVYLRRESDAAP